MTERPWPAGAVTGIGSLPGTDVVEAVRLVAGEVPELPSGHRVVTDHGAPRELAESLAEGLRRHLADVARRAPSAKIVLQLDEPSLPAVLDGQVPTPSGWGTVRSVGPNIVEQTLGQ